jgi:ribosomal protein S21
MPKIEVTKCGGNADVAIRKLKRLCDRLGILKRIRALEHHVKATTKRRRMKDAARKRVLKRQSQLEATILGRRRRQRYR